MLPGCSEYAVIPSPANPRCSDSVNKMLAVLLCAYVTMPL